MICRDDVLNPAERGTYDSDATAVLTLSELEHWLALAITGRYHHEVHEGIMEPPLVRWKRGIAEHGDPRAVGNSREFLVDFLPVVRRTIQRDGFRLDHITYYSDVLRPWIANRDQHRSSDSPGSPRPVADLRARAGWTKLCDCALQASGAPRNLAL